ncbi:M14 family zinc carboxypeptidase [Amycolatopsis japonica]|uniref:M14 family zinc carboxypeptidase n=1 Tax=Amycolatopsis japonica TaxID=208439 RepID=UPI0037890001
MPGLDLVYTVDEVNAAVDQLVAETPSICRVRTIGASRQGEPLRLLSVGHGSRNALVVGGPHPNEPIGLLTVVHLARVVAQAPELRDGIDFAWHFVPCIDPDGTRLNEGWFAEPRTIRNYHREFYRPALDEQPEWTFPVLDERAYFDRMLPETEALAGVIDELRPSFQYSLHNADFGGVFFILNKDVPGAADDFARMSEELQVPLSLGPLDTLGWQTLGPAVYLMPTAEALIAANARGAAKADARHGGSSSHYAEKYGTTTLVTEVPVWRDGRASDDSDSGLLYGDVLRTSADRLREDVGTLTELRQRIRALVDVRSPMWSAAADFLDLARALAAAHDAIATTVGTRSATVAEVFAAETVVHMLRLRTVGVLCRQLAGECQPDRAPLPLHVAHKELDSLFDIWCEQAEESLSEEAFPLSRLVALQMAAALSVVLRLADQ